MAITTQNRRRSVSGYSGLVIAPVADAVISNVDREHVTGLYGGIPAAPVGGTSLLAMERATFRRVFSRIFGRVN